MQMKRGYRTTRNRTVPVEIKKMGNEEEKRTENQKSKSKQIKESPSALSRTDAETRKTRLVYNTNEALQHSTAKILYSHTTLGEQTSSAFTR